MIRLLYKRIEIFFRKAPCFFAIHLTTYRGGSLLAHGLVKLPFTMYIERRLLETYKEYNGKYNFYGYIIEDSEEPVPRVDWEEAIQSSK